MCLEQRMMNGKNCFVWDNPEEDLIEDLALNMMEQNQIHGFLPFRMVHHQKESYFRYDMTDQTVLASWLKKVHGKKEILQLLDSIVTAFDETEQYLMDPDHLYTDTAFIVVDQNRCHFAYIPMRNYKNEGILDFVQEILNQIKYAKDESCIYIFDLMNAITREDIRNVAELKKWMKMLQMGEAVSAEPFENEVTEEPETMTTMVSSEPREQKSGMFSFAGRKKEKRTQQVSPMIAAKDADEFENIPKIDQRMQYIKQISDDVCTVLVDSYQKNALIRCSTGEEYLIEAQRYVIGSGGKKHVDILISGNPAISHVHAQIVRKNDVISIMDLNSTNGTYINGEKLKGTEHELTDGMRITLADEEFVFEKRGGFRDGT